MSSPCPTTPTAPSASTGRPTAPRSPTQIGRASSPSAATSWPNDLATACSARNTVWWATPTPRGGGSSTRSTAPVTSCAASPCGRRLWRSPTPSTARWWGSCPRQRWGGVGGRLGAWGPSPMVIAVVCPTLHDSTRRRCASPSRRAGTSWASPTPWCNCNNRPTAPGASATSGSTCSWPREQSTWQLMLLA